MSLVFAVSATKFLESNNSRLSCSRRSLPPRASAQICRLGNESPVSAPGLTAWIFCYPGLCCEQ